MHLVYRSQRYWAYFLGDHNGGQKCWGLSSDITKTSDPSPPTPNKVEFGAKWVKLSAFFDHNIARGRWRGGQRDEPNAEQKMSLGAEFYGIIACKGFFTQSQVLLSSIVVRKAFRLYWDTNEDDDLNGGSTQIFMNIWSSQLCRYFIWNCFNTVSITTATIMSCLINPG